MALITCENISVRYEDTDILHHLNFKVEEGDYLCVIGENGSGKTTLMKTILGLLKPSEGKIVFGDGLDEMEIGYLPQQTITQRDFPATVYEVVLSGCLNQLGKRKFFGKREKEMALENMKRLHIEDLKDRSYRALSGGQQQRVLLARALCATKKLLLLDEPVTGLDPNTSKELYDLIHALNKEGIAIVMISHDVKEVYKYAKHLLALDEEIFFGDTKEYIQKKSQEVGAYL